MKLKPADLLLQTLRIFPAIYGIAFTLPLLLHPLRGRADLRLLGMIPDEALSVTALVFMGVFFLASLMALAGRMLPASAVITAMAQIIYGSAILISRAMGLYNSCGCSKNPDAYPDALTRALTMILAGLVITAFCVLRHLKNRRG
jgi:hypothetical protein